MGLRALKQRGDTIVEVLIVLAVLGMALSISYATADRSLLNMRQAEENSQAAEYLQSQVEILRSMASNAETINGSPNPNYIFKSDASSIFCVYYDTGTNAYTVVNESVSNPDPNCQYGNIPYTITITFSHANYDTFSLNATWPDVLGPDTDSVALSYRLHPPYTAPSIPMGGTSPTTPTTPFQILKPAPGNVSWFNQGKDGTCTPSADCVNSHDNNPYSLTGITNANMTYDYSYQPGYLKDPGDAPPGESLPVPGQNNLSLKICYYSEDTSKVSISIGGDDEYPSESLSNNGTVDDIADCPAPYNNVNLPITTPYGDSTLVVLKVLSGKLEIYNLTIYSTTK